MRSGVKPLAVLALGLLSLSCESATAPETAPVVESVAADAHPAVPAGLKVTCHQGPDSNQASPTCPVIRWLGRTYWAYSHEDNRGAMTLVAYDQAGIVKQLEKAGARYL